MTTKQIATWQDMAHECCPNCGDDVEVFTDYPPGWFGEDDEARCAALCGWEGYVCVADDGDGRMRAYLSDGNIEELPVPT